jgi:predicted methyltransferase
VSYIKKLVLAFLSLIVSGFSWVDGHLNLGRAVANSDRAHTDTARDASRKPTDVLEFFGIALGMKVLDIFLAQVIPLKF